MVKDVIVPTGRESAFLDDELIVSKTDLSGRITYANNVFLRVSRYLPHEIIGAPHNVIRHPDMPRCIFRLLWETIEAKNEMFGYILNMASNGDHYWVFAHVTPSFDRGGNHVGYHSNRRKPEPDKVAKVVRLYATLLEEERRASDPKAGLVNSYNKLQDILKNEGVGYDEFIFSL